jgi:hypothetical protein
MSEKENKGQFPKGTSGNLAGRPVGSSNRTMSDRQLQELCGKKVKGAMDVVLDLMRDSDNENVKLKSALAIIAQDATMRAFMYKKIIDEKKLRAEGGGKAEEPEEDHTTPVISLKAVT